MPLFSINFHCYCHPLYLTHKKQEVWEVNLAVGVGRRQGRGRGTSCIDGYLTAVHDDADKFLLH